MKKFLKSKLFIGATTVVILCLFIFFHFIAPRIVISRRSSKKSYPKFEDFSVQHESFFILSKDDLKLAGEFCFSNLETTLGTVIFLHGIGSRKERFLPMVEVLANNGFQSILIDMRAHGESDGDYVTFGYYETDDISQMISYSDSLYSINNLGIWGQSLGGSIALQMLAKDKRISYGIIESTYSRFDEVVHNYANRIVGFSLGFLNDYLIWRAQSIGEFDKKELNPEDACKKIEQPVLYVHGTKDDRIDVSCASRNFDNLKSLDKELILIPGANHVNVWQTGGITYQEKCLEFLKRNH